MMIINSGLQQRASGVATLIAVVLARSVRIQDSFATRLFRSRDDGKTAGTVLKERVIGEN